MIRYLIRQTLLSAFKLFIFVTIMFFFIQIMMPGDWVDQFSLFCDSECRARMRAELGLDLPIGQRYLEWLKDLARLDLGTSLEGTPLVEVLKEVVPATLLVFLVGTALAFLLGLWLGKVTAWRGSGVISRLTTLGGIILFTSFPPWLAWLLTRALAQGRDFVVMGERGGLRRVSMYNFLDRELWMNIEVSPFVIAFHMVLTIIGATILLLLINWLLERLTRRRIPGAMLLVLICLATIGSWFALQIDTLAIDIAKAAWFPILTFALLSFGETMIIMQSSMTEVLKEEYVTTAQAKGLPVSVVREKHAARNALLPVLSRLVISLPYLVTGVVIIESSLGWPGMGTSMWNALYWQNMPVVMSTLLIVGLLSLVARLVLDVVIAYADPRIRYDQPQLTAV